MELSQRRFQQRALGPCITCIAVCQQCREPGRSSLSLGESRTQSQPHTFRNGGGKTQRIAEFPVQGCESAYLGPLRRTRRWKQVLDRRAQIGMDAQPHRFAGDTCAFIKRDPGADLVLLDHRQVSVRRSFGTPEDGQHLRRSQTPQSHDPAKTRDQAEMSVTLIYDLDRNLLSPGGDAGFEGLHLVRVEGDPVTCQMAGFDPVQWQTLCQTPLVTSLRQGTGHVLERGLRRGVGGDARDGRSLKTCL